MSISGYLTLGTALSGSTVITPPTGTNYAPQVVNFTTMAGGISLLGTSAVFGPVVGSWGTLTVFGVTDELGNPVIAPGTLQSPFTPVNGQLVYVPMGDISIVVGSQFTAVPVSSAGGNQQGTLTSGAVTLTNNSYSLVLPSGARSALALQNTSNIDTISLVIGGTLQPVSGSAPSSVIPPFQAWPPPSMGDFVSTDFIWAMSGRMGTTLTFLTGG
jgi:hypothetical protein